MLAFWKLIFFFSPVHQSKPTPPQPSPSPSPSPRSLPTLSTFRLSMLIFEAAMSSRSPRASPRAPPLAPASHPRSTFRRMRRRRMATTTTSRKRPYARPRPRARPARKRCRASSGRATAGSSIAARSPSCCTGTTRPCRRARSVSFCVGFFLYVYPHLVVCVCACV